MCALCIQCLQTFKHDWAVCLFQFHDGKAFILVIVVISYHHKHTDTNRRDDSTVHKLTTTLCVATHFSSLIRLLTLHKLNMKFMLNLAWFYFKLPFQEVLLHPLSSTSLWKCLKCVWCMVTASHFMTCQQLHYG